MTRTWAAPSSTLRSRGPRSRRCSGSTSPRALPPPTPLGNLLYRIEIHDPGLPVGGGAGKEGAPVATFKWSRENGSRTFPIVSFAGAQVTLSSPESGRLTMPEGSESVMNTADGRYQHHMTLLAPTAAIAILFGLTSSFGQLFSSFGALTYG